MAAILCHAQPTTWRNSWAGLSASRIASGLSGVDRSGGHEGILRAFRNTLGPIRYRELQPLLLSIRPTFWGRSKLEAIDLGSRDWLWIDDAHGEAEMILLKVLSLQDRAIPCQRNGLQQVREIIETNWLTTA